jgi:erythromycin esterase
VAHRPSSTGDWPDCYEINRFIKGAKEAPYDIRSVLETFHRWPTYARSRMASCQEAQLYQARVGGRWMWANWEVAALATWLRKHNHGRDLKDRVGECPCVMS